MSAAADAFSALYRRVGPLAGRLARSILLDASLSEDVVQEAFLRVWRRREQLSEPEALDGYVVRSVRNLAYKRVRRRRVEATATAHLQATAVWVTTPTSDEGTPNLAAALAALPPEQREVVHLRIYEGFAMTAISEQTRVPLGTVHSRYRYALEKLRAVLSEGGDERTGVRGRPRHSS